MLRPKVKAKEFEKFGFKRCKGIPKELNVTIFAFQEVAR